MCLSTWPNFTTVLYPRIFGFSMTDFSLPCSLLGGHTPACQGFMALGPDHMLLFWVGPGEGRLHCLEGLRSGCLTWKGALALGVGWSSEPIPGQPQGVGGSPSALFLPSS